MRLWDDLVEVEGDSLVLLVEGGIGGLERAFCLPLLSGNFSAMDFKLMCVQGDFFRLLLHFDIDVDLSLVGPSSAEL